MTEDKKPAKKPAAKAKKPATAAPKVKKVVATEAAPKVKKPVTGMTSAPKVKKPATLTVALPLLPKFDVPLPDMLHVDPSHLPQVDLTHLPRPKLDMPHLGLPKVDMPHFDQAVVDKAVADAMELAGTAKTKADAIATDVRRNVEHTVTRMREVVGL